MRIDNITKKIFGLLFVLLFSTCDNVNFDNYFPSDQKPLDKIESDFLGKYYYTDSFMGKKEEERFFNSKYFSSTIDSHDSIILFTADLNVSERLILYSVDFTGFYKLEKNDTSRLNKKFNYKDVYIKDRYFIHKENYTDTLLDLDKKDKLFFYKNLYYLNHFNKTNSDLGKEKCWTICQFERCGPSLFSINMTNREDYKMLFDTTKNWQPIFPIAHISNKKFKTFVDKGGFHQKYKLIKY